MALNAITRNAGATWVIPNEDEWYKAAYYSPVLGIGGYWDFPTQSNTINTSMASYNKGSWTAPENINSYGYPSYYGTKDQGGNILEWIESAFASNQRVNRGGMYYSPESELKASYRKGENPETSHLRYLGFRVATLDMDLGDPKRIYPNDDTTVRGTTNYNNTHPFGLFVKRNGDVSYIEFNFGITHANSAKLVLWQDNPDLHAGYTIVIRGDEFDFNEGTFNNSSLGDTWPLLGMLAVSGVAPVQAFYEFDITDWYNDNLGKRMSLFLRNDGTWN
ncbi:MAG: formylglycine-generating enzyme family protein, partial [Phycisphaerales bacterium]|nr:formylglycine-generating enzyme family protein [Phycisphaerales bacterium]